MEKSDCLNLDLQYGILQLPFTLLLVTLSCLWIKDKGKRLWNYTINTFENHHNPQWISPEHIGQGSAQKFCYKRDGKNRLVVWKPSNLKAEHKMWLVNLRKRSFFFFWIKRSTLHKTLYKPCEINDGTPSLLTVWSTAQIKSSTPPMAPMSTLVNEQGRSPATFKILCSCLYWLWWKRSSSVGINIFFCYDTATWVPPRLLHH